MLRFSSEPLSIGEIYSQAIKLFITPFIYLYFLAIPLSADLLFKYFLDGTWKLNIVVNTHPLAFFSYIFIKLFYGFVLAGMAYHQIDTYIKNEKSKFISSFIIGIKKFPIMLLATICALLTVLVGTLLLVVPGIYLLGALFVIGPVVILENMSILEIIPYTLQLVWGNWWRTFVVLILPFIVVELLLFISAIVIFLILNYFSVEKIHIRLIFDCFEMLVVPFFMILSYILQVLQFHDLKLRRQKKTSETCS